MINCWHKQDGRPFRQVDLNHQIKSPAVTEIHDIDVPDWLSSCELTKTIFDYIPDLDIFPPCVNFFNHPTGDIVIVLGIRPENANGILADSDFIMKSIRNISVPLSGTPRALDNMIPVGWIGYEKYQDNIYVNNNQVSGHLRSLLTRRQMSDIHQLLLDFLEICHPGFDIRVAHHSSIGRWIQKYGKPGQRYMEFPYTSRVMRGWEKLEEHGWSWWVRPAIHVPTLD